MFCDACVSSLVCALNFFVLKNTVLRVSFGHFTGYFRSKVKQNKTKKTLDVSWLKQLFASFTELSRILISFHFHLLWTGSHCTLKCRYTNIMWISSKAAFHALKNRKPAGDEGCFVLTHCEICHSPWVWGFFLQGGRGMKPDHSSSCIYIIYLVVTYPGCHKLRFHMAQESWMKRKSNWAITSM